MIDKTDLSSLSGKPPNDLLSHAIIGPRLRAIIPKEQLRCLDDIFNHAPDLVETTRGVNTALKGSRADNFMQVFVDVRSDGSFDVAMNCDPESNPKGPYMLFSNQPVDSNLNRSTLEWLELVSESNDRLIRSNGKETRTVGISSVLAPVSPLTTPVALPQHDSKRESERATETTNQPSPKKVAVNVVQRGALVCVTLLSFNKASAIARTGNNIYATFPDDCILMNDAKPIQIIGNSPMPGVAMIQAGGTTAFTSISSLAVVTR